MSPTRRVVTPCPPAWPQSLQAFSNPYLDQRLMGDTQFLGLPVQTSDHPSRKTHVHAICLDPIAQHSAKEGEGRTDATTTGNVVVGDRGGLRSGLGGAPEGDTAEFSKFVSIRKKSPTFFDFGITDLASGAVELPTPDALAASLAKSEGNCAGSFERDGTAIRPESSGVRKACRPT